MHVLTVIVSLKYTATVEPTTVSLVVSRACQNTKSTFSLLPFSDREIVLFWRLVMQLLIIRPSNIISAFPGL